jgi:hypothetical protein
MAKETKKVEKSPEEIKKEKIGKLEKFYLGKYAYEKLQQEDVKSASYALALYGEKEDIHEKAFLYEKGIEEASKFLTSKYYEPIKDSSLEGYLSLLGIDAKFKEPAKTKISKIEETLKDLNYKIEKEKDETKKNKLAEQANYLAKIQELVHYAEKDKFKDVDNKIIKLRKEGLVKLLRVEEKPKEKNKK